MDKRIIIEVILQAKDRMQPIVQRAVAETRRELDKLTRTVNSLPGARSFEKTLWADNLKNVRQLNVEYKKLKQSVKEYVDAAKKGQIKSPVGQVFAGREIAKRTAKEYEEAFRIARKDFNERFRRLNQEFAQHKTNLEKVRQIRLNLIDEETRKRKLAVEEEIKDLTGLRGRQSSAADSRVQARIKELQESLDKIVERKATSLSKEINILNTRDERERNRRGVALDKEIRLLREANEKNDKKAVETADKLIIKRNEQLQKETRALEDRLNKEREGIIKVRDTTGVDAKKIQARREIRENRAELKREKEDLAKAAELDLKRIEKERDAVLTKKSVEKQIIAAKRAAFNEEIKQLKTAHKSIVKERESAVGWEIELIREATKQNINDLEAAAKKRNEIDQKGLQNAIKLKQKQADEDIGIIRSNLTEEFRLRSENLEREKTRRRVSLEQEIAPTQSDSIRAAIDKRQQHLSTLDSAFQRVGARAGFFFGDISRGFQSTEKGVKKLSFEVLKAETPIFRIGNAFGTAFRQANRLINLRFASFLSFFQVFGTVVTYLANAFVLLGSSAVQAGTAIAGAAAAAAAQAIPVFALLQATLLRLDDINKAVQLREQNRLAGSTNQEDAIKRQKDATDRLSDAQYNLRKAIEGVTDANENILDAQRKVSEAREDEIDAIKNLAEARKEAQRDIVDANIQERESALSLQEAELAVLSAKEALRAEREKGKQGSSLADARAQVKEAQARLDLAKKQGQEVEVSTAATQLALAKQNVNDIISTTDSSETRLKQLNIGVKRAGINLEQAKINRKQQHEETTQINKKGIEGSDAVIRAQKALTNAQRGFVDSQKAVRNAIRGQRDALHSVAIAQRDVRRAQEDLTESTSKHTAAQKNLLNILKDLSPAERALYNAINRLRDTVRTQFRPITDTIISAFARGVQRGTDVLKDPKILGAFRNLSSSIARTIDRITASLSTGENKANFAFFINEAAKNVPKLGKALENLLTVFLRLAKAATPLFNSLIDRFVAFTDRIAQSTNNANSLEKLFSVAGRHLNSWIALGVAIGKVFIALFNTDAAGQGSTLIDNLGTQLEKLSVFINSNPERINKFFKEARIEVEKLAKILFGAGKTLFNFFTSEKGRDFTNFVLESLLPAFATFLKAVGSITQALTFLFNLPLVGGLFTFFFQVAVVEKLINKLFPATQLLTRAFKELFALQLGASSVSWFKIIGNLPLKVAAAGKSVLAFSALLSGRAIAAVKGFAAASRAALIATGWGALAIAIGIAIYLIIKHWDRIKVAARDTFGGIIDIAKKVGTFFRTEWKTILLGMFSLPVSLILRFKNLGADLISGLIDGIKSKASELKDKIVDMVLSPYEYLKRKLGISSPARFTYDMGRDLSDGLINGITSRDVFVRNAIVNQIDSAIRAGRRKIESSKSLLRLGLDNLSSAVSAQFNAIGGKPVAAEIELERIEKAEARKAQIEEIKEADKRITDVKRRLDSLLSQQTQLSKKANIKIDTSKGGIYIPSRTISSTSAQDLRQQIKDTRRELSEIQLERKRILESHALENRKTQLIEEAKTQRELQEVAAIGGEKQAQSYLDSFNKKTELLLAGKISLKAWTKGLNDLRDKLSQLKVFESVGGAMGQALVDEVIKAIEGPNGIRRSAISVKKETDLIVKRQKDLIEAKNQEAKTFAEFIIGRDEGGIKARSKDLTGQSVFPQDPSELLKLGIVSGGLNRNQTLRFAKSLSKDKVGSSLDALRDVKVSRGFFKDEIAHVPFTKDKTVADVIGELRKENLNISDRDILIKLLKGHKSAKNPIIQAFLASIDTGSFAHGGVGITKASGQPGFVRELAPNNAVNYHSDEWLVQGSAIDNITKLVGGARHKAANFLFYDYKKQPGAKGAPLNKTVNEETWVLNPFQQSRLAKSIKKTVSETKQLVFAGKNALLGTKGQKPTSDLKPSKTASDYVGPNFTLRALEDKDNVPIWFIQFDDGTWGRVNPRDVDKIVNSNGGYVPGYVKRSPHGLTEAGQGLRRTFEYGVDYLDVRPKLEKFASRNFGGYSLGGIATPSTSSFALGGIVGTTPSSGGRAGNTVNQNFNVNTQGESDWHYIMRLSKVHALELG